MVYAKSAYARGQCRHAKKHDSLLETTKKKKKREGGKGAGAEHCGHQCPYDAPIHDNYKFDTTATIIATRRADQAFWFPVRNRVVAALVPGAAVAAGYDV